MSLIILRRLSIIVLSCMLITACTDDRKIHSVPLAPEPTYEVNTINPEYKNRERTFYLSGRVRAYTRADVRPQVGGVIMKRLFEEGARVEEGTPLYQIDPAPFQASLEHAEASWQRAVVKKNMAQKDFERFEALFKRRSASEKERDDALLVYELAVADEKLYRSAVQTARISLEYTQVRAPISGIISSSKVTRGALVNANQSSPLTTIIDLDKVYVDMAQSANEWRHLREGILEGSIYFNDRAYDIALLFQDDELYAHLGKLSLSEVLVDEHSGSVTLRAIFDNPEHLLLPGMAVLCKLNGGISQNVMTIPSAAVLRDHKGNPYVYTVQGGIAIPTPVRLGRLYNDGWQILEGLNENHEVLVTGIAELPPRSRVRVIRHNGVEINQPTNKINNTTGITSASGLGDSTVSAQ